MSNLLKVLSNIVMVDFTNLLNQDAKHVKLCLYVWIIQLRCPKSEINSRNMKIFNKVQRVFERASMCGASESKFSQPFFEFSQPFFHEKKT